ncbi:hypothetical protein O6H91_Y420900 [Diphasiastrum complanatum]|nr:hypothetical protein O6H91_Y420900 [Diphasiastrum complanatum]
MSGSKPIMRLLRLRGFPIFQQLQVEERLLRDTQCNWCIINDGTAPPSIVMGISGKPELLLDVRAVIQDQVPVIRRFSGGGTVIVNSDTVFVTIICNRDAVPNLSLYPHPIMRWTEQLYAPVFEGVPGFQLREHDYVLGSLKFGGNAQSIIKNRWLHHTSFLWDYDNIQMQYLKLPSRAPSYRLARPHGDFICRLKDYLPSRDLFLQTIVSALQVHFIVQGSTIDDTGQNMPSKSPRTTKILTSVQLDSFLTDCNPKV